MKRKRQAEKPRYPRGGGSRPLSPLEVRVPDSRAKTISRASRNNSKPPEYAKRLEADAHEIKERRPPSANSSRITADTPTAFSAMPALVTGGWRRQ